MKEVYKKFWIPFTNLYLIKWRPNGLTDIHGHKGTDCNLFVVKGSLKETLYKKINDNNYVLKSSQILRENQSSHINDSKGYHSIKNLSDKYSWSLHRYSKLLS